MESSKKRRQQALTDADRLLIRNWNRTHPPAFQKDLAEWFTKETGHEINQGMILKILSLVYAHLDTLDLKKNTKELRGSRRLNGDWPDLDGALFEWQQRMEAIEAIITGDILKEKASAL